MKEENIKINYETIGVMEKRNLIEITRALSNALTNEDYISIMSVYQKVLDRLEREAENQGINF